MPTYKLGVLICEQDRSPPFGSESFYRELCRAGQRIGLEVFIFSSSWVQWNSRTTYGYAYDNTEQTWKKKRYSLPTLIYDRSFTRHTKHIAAKKRFLSLLASDKSIRFLGQPLRDKWSVYTTLSRDPILRHHLPQTIKLNRFSALLNMWKVHPKIYIKPSSSSQGKGVLYLHKTASTVIVQGKTLQNEPIQRSFQNLFVSYIWLQQMMQGRLHIVQPALKLTTEQGRPYDLRVLMQKNRIGLWECSGSAVRLGLPGSVISNLHGGGSSSNGNSFLTEQFGSIKKDKLLTTIQWLSHRAVARLEKQYGNMVEMGLDFGIEREGKIWLIEANSKPGRSAFVSVSAVHQKTIEQPIRFAKFLLERQ